MLNKFSSWLNCTPFKKVYLLEQRSTARHFESLGMFHSFIPFLIAERFLFDSCGCGFPTYKAICIQILTYYICLQKVKVTKDCVANDDDDDDDAVRSVVRETVGWKTSENSQQEIIFSSRHSVSDNHLSCPSCPTSCYGSQDFLLLI